MEDVVTVNNLSKVYGPNAGIQNVSLSVQPGEIFGFVGPANAGKTTLLECVMGLRRHDDGHVEVLGLDPLTRQHTLLQLIGIQLQHTELPGRMKVWEALKFFSSFYRNPISWELLLEQWDLTEYRHTSFRELTGDLRQRLFIALTLINDPEIIFLDELTPGLDPQSRRIAWNLIRKVRDLGKTVILVTRFMDEIERLCDRIAIVDQMQIIALDTPQALIRHTYPEHSIHFQVPTPTVLASFANISGLKDLSRDGNRVSITGEGDLLSQIVTIMVQRRLPLENVQIKQASLEDVFQSLTGRTLHEDHAKLCS